MAYTPTTWVDGTTPVNASNLNKIEQGVDVADQAAVDAAAAAAAAQTAANAAIAKALVDAKGDLIVASGADVVARLPLGTDGQVLTADAAQPLGLKYAAPAAAGVPSYGTTLPASPVDGQEAILVNSVTNPTYQWRFRYNASSTSPYKWEFVGGMDMRHEVEGTVSKAGASSALSGGPTLTLPRAGDYLFGFGTDVYCDVQYASLLTHLAINGAQQGSVFLAAGQVSAGQANSQSVARQITLAGRAAGDVLAMWGGVSSGTGAWRQRWFSLRPVRVA